jgi:hypothetical protein
MYFIVILYLCEYAICENVSQTFRYTSERQYAASLNNAIYTLWNEDINAHDYARQAHSRGVHICSIYTTKKGRAENVLMSCI